MEFTAADNRMLKALHIAQVEEAPQDTDEPNFNALAHVGADVAYCLTEADLDINTRDAAIHWCEEAQKSDAENQALTKQNAALKRTVHIQSYNLIYAAVKIC